MVRSGCLRPGGRWRHAAVGVMSPEPYDDAGWAGGDTAAGVTAGSMGAPLTDVSTLAARALGVRARRPWICGGRPPSRPSSPCAATPVLASALAGRLRNGVPSPPVYAARRRDAWPTAAPPPCGSPAALAARCAPPHASRRCGHQAGDAAPALDPPAENLPVRGCRRRTRAARPGGPQTWAPSRFLVGVTLPRRCHASA